MNERGGGEVTGTQDSRRLSDDPAGGRGRSSWVGGGASAGRLEPRVLSDRAPVRAIEAPWRRCDDRACSTDRLTPLPACPILDSNCPKGTG